MKHFFIVNPVAGGKDSTEVIRAMALSAFSQSDESFELICTTGPHDAEETVRRIAESGEQARIYACGGDGTFSECVNGAAGYDNIALAPIPIGTGNDFCRMFGEEGRFYLDLPALLQGSTHKIDLISVNGRYSACICSVGIDARVGTNVHKYTSLPFCRGGGAYVVSAVVELLKGITRPMKLTCGDFSYDGKATLCCVCNGRHYGGGFNPSPDAMPDDGILDIYFVRDMNLLQVATAIGKYAKGQADLFPQYITHLKGDSVTIEFAEEEVINADGEAIFAKKANIKLIPGALNLIVPDGVTFFD
ncbi:MAG: diacylglycerol kinase family lipid kinase [Oscillospiraceae bacterium]|nr:diacylglycerol kinase family lipid kinase [Oscillospiraceae bacterium]